MFNRNIAKTLNQEEGTKDFYKRRKKNFSKENLSYLEKDELNSKEYKQSFDKLHNLQNLLKKESSLRELCKYIILLFL